MKALDRPAAVCPQPVSLDLLLAARDDRVKRRETLRLESGCPVITMTLNIPGPVKRTPLSAFFFDREKRQLERILEGLGGRLAGEDLSYALTGDEAHLALEGLEAGSLKALTVSLEEEGPASRLLDLDVYDRGGRPLGRKDLGLPLRTCLLCSRPAAQCGSRGLHDSGELAKETGRLLEDYAKNALADHVAALALEASSFELMVHPKPGLVTFESSGSHKDMDRFTFIGSQSLFSSFYRQCFRAGWEGETAGSRLRLAGVRAEGAMLDKTGGVNTHRGWIFISGILLAAMGAVCRRLLSSAGQPEDPALFLQHEALRLAGELENTLGRKPWSVLLEERLGGPPAGVRLEALHGFPSLFGTGLPVFLQSAKEDPNRAGQRTLLALMAAVHDTTLIKRGGDKRAAAIRQDLADRFEGDPVQGALALTAGELDVLVKELGIVFEEEALSAGGAADLLAGCHLAGSFLEGSVIVL